MWVGCGYVDGRLRGYGCDKVGLDRVCTCGG